MLKELSVSIRVSIIGVRHIRVFAIFIHLPVRRVLILRATLFNGVSRLLLSIIVLLVDPVDPAARGLPPPVWIGSQLQAHD